MKKIILVFFFPVYLMSADMQITDFQALRFLSSNLVLSAGLAQTEVSEALAGKDAVLLWDFSSKESLPGKAVMPLLRSEGYAGGCLEFLTSENELTVKNLPQTFFNAWPSTGSFTLEMYFYLYDSREDMILFQKYGPVLDTQTDDILPQGVRILIRSHTVCAEFDNFFHHRSRHLSLKMNQGKALLTKKWHHAAISWNEDTGVLTKIVNGKIEQTLTAESGGTVYHPAFFPENRYPVIIGKSFLGMIDEVKLTEKPSPILSASRYTTEDSFWISQTFKNPPHSKITQLHAKTAAGSPGTVLAWIRSSKNYFLPEEESPQWMQVPCNGASFDWTNGAGSFSQVKFAVKNPSAQKATKVQSINLHFESDETPQTPVLISVEPKKLALQFTWQVTSEEDVSGWSIWYTAGTDFTAGKKKISISREDLQRRGGLNGRQAVYLLEGLADGEIVSAAITAYDSLGTEHESAFSKIFQAAALSF